MKLPAFLAVCIFCTLIGSAWISANHNFRVAKDSIVADLNEALMQALKDRSDRLITPDTIRAYRHLQQVGDGPVLLAIKDRHFIDCLKHVSLKNRAYLTFDLNGQPAPIQPAGEDWVISDTLWLADTDNQMQVAFRSYARCNFGTIFTMSDQRLSFTLLILALCWGTGACIYLRKQQRASDKSIAAWGGLRFAEDEQQFYDTHNNLIRLTPMQTQLMMLFYQHPQHTLSKEVICQTLWPKKTDANDTLYTLMKRIRPIIETHTQLKITSDRGKSYRLEIRD